MYTPTWTLKENTESINWILRCFQEGVIFVPKAHSVMEMKT